jgi:hypothetical protein
MELARLKGSTLMNRFGVQDLLLKCIPTLDSSPIDLHLHGSKSQELLNIAAKKLFGNVDLCSKWNYRHPRLQYMESGNFMELDIFIESMNLAFEYQGKQHYQVDIYFGKENLFMRDEQKRISCRMHNISLIRIPYYLNNIEELLQYLKLEISKERPDLANCMI